MCFYEEKLKLLGYFHKNSSINTINGGNYVCSEDKEYMYGTLEDKCFIF